MTTNKKAIERVFDLVEQGKKLILDGKKELEKGKGDLQIWAEKNKIKTRIQYFCGVCGSFVSKDTLQCRVCKEKSDLLVE
jgi:rubrerythrin